MELSEETLALMDAGRIPIYETRFMRPFRQDGGCKEEWIIQRYYVDGSSEEIVVVGQVHIFSPIIPYFY